MASGAPPNGMADRWDRPDLVRGDPAGPGCLRPRSRSRHGRCAGPAGPVPCGWHRLHAAAGGPGWADARHARARRGRRPRRAGTDAGGGARLRGDGGRPGAVLRGGRADADRRWWASRIGSPSASATRWRSTCRTGRWTSSGRRTAACRSRTRCACTAGFRRVLRPGGRLVTQEPMAGPGGPTILPTMWAATQEDGPAPGAGRDAGDDRGGRRSGSWPGRRSCRRRSSIRRRPSGPCRGS